MTAFQILGEPVRIFLIETLCVGEQTSGDLAELAHERFGISWSAVSRHLVTMRRSGFVRVIRDEWTRWYALDDTWLDLVADEVEALRRPWGEHRVIRGYGFADSIPYEGTWLPEDPAEVRARRGASARCFARRGIGRSEDVDDADGGAGLS